MIDFTKHPARGIGIFGLIVCLAISTLGIFPKGAEVLFFQRLHQPLTDLLMLFITRLAEWPAITLVMLYLLFTKDKKGVLIAGCSLILLSVSVQSLKHFLPDNPRPVQSFQSLGILALPNWELHHHNSFPSGHTATAVALYLMLYFFFPGGTMLALCTIAWVGVAISRMYLLQHFLADVTAGLLIGFVFSLPVLFYTQRKNSGNNG